MSKSPAWSELAEQLVGDICSGRYALGARLPTEAELCAASGLSRGTVRQALQHIDRLGMISRRQRTGSTVVATTALPTYEPVVGSADDIMALVRTTKIVKPLVRELVVGRQLAGRLGARPGSTWHVVEGLRVHRTHEGPPLCWSEQYARSGTGVDALARGTFTVEEAASAETHQVVTAEPLEPSLARVLQTTSSVALVVVRRHLDGRGRVMSAGVHIHPADRFALRSVIARQPS